MHQVSTNLLNRKAAAAYLTIPVRTLDELTRAQKVACVRFNARCVRYRTEDLDALVSDLTDKAAMSSAKKAVAPQLDAPVASVCAVRKYGTLREGAGRAIDVTG